MSEIIKIDTYVLMSNIERLKRIKIRIADIDSELNALNKEFNLSTLLGLEYNKLQKYNYILNANIDYLYLLVNKFDNITNTLNKLDPLNYTPPKSIVDIIQETLKIIPHGDIPVMYLVIFKKYIENKGEALFDLPQYAALFEKTINGIQFVNDNIFDDIGDVKSFLEYLTNQEIELGKFDKVMDLADHLDNFITILTDIRDGKISNIGESVFSELGLALKKLSKTDSVAGDAVIKVMIDSVTNIPTKFIEDIKRYANDDPLTAGEIWWDTIVEGVGSAVVDLAEPVYNLTTSITYPIIDDMLETVCGFDLSGTYENLSDKKGIEAVIDVQKQLWVDTVYENGIKKAGVKIVNGFYQGSDKLISTCWKKLVSFK